MIDAPAVGLHVASVPAVGNSTGGTASVITHVYLQDAQSALHLNSTLDLTTLAPYSPKHKQLRRAALQLGALRCATDF
jgi:hypothetical protein